MSASRFQWTDGGAQSFVTDLHAQNQVPEKVYSTYGNRSLDKSAIEVVTVGSGVREMTVTIMAERNVSSLRAFQAAAKRGLSFTYTPDNVGAPGTTYTVTAVPGSVGKIGIDPRGRQDMFTLTLTLARLDGGVFPPDV